MLLWTLRIRRLWYEIWRDTSLSTWKNALTDSRWQSTWIDVISITDYRRCCVVESVWNNHFLSRMFLRVRRNTRNIISRTREDKSITRTTEAVCRQIVVGVRVEFGHAVNWVGVKGRRQERGSVWNAVPSNLYINDRTGSIIFHVKCSPNHV